MVETTGSEPVSPACEAGALPIELHPRIFNFRFQAPNVVAPPAGFEPATFAFGGRCSCSAELRGHLVETAGIRTRDLLHAMQALSQLSYVPIGGAGRGTRTPIYPLKRR